MIIRSKAPLRIGLAGGGTDLGNYADRYGGAVLNATISMYAYATIQPRQDGHIVIHALDRNIVLDTPVSTELPMKEGLYLHAGVYHRIVKDFVNKPLSFELTTLVDAPPGSGLGSSSTLVVAILGAFAEWLKIPLGEYDIAQLAYEIERIDLKMAGGKQDQYAATFGGVNFMEFYKDNKVIVNPLRINESNLNELSYNLILYNTEVSRLSNQIIETQQKNVLEQRISSIQAMHGIREQAFMMKEALLRGELEKIGEILDFGWHHKKQMAQGITNPYLDEIYDTALKAGATGGKISGAGGGGFMVLYCPGNSRGAVLRALQRFGGQVKRYGFTAKGLTTWSI
ncbi:MAG: dehydrogenase [Bacteroidales bacterium]|nr:dehydrogenase [Lentimicrobiaceae bacterium]MDD5695338.1 dehydrogenase [Bacteroidales bacterium]